MSLKDLNNISAAGSIQNTDQCVIKTGGTNNYQPFSEVALFVNSTSGLIANTDLFLFADKNTGHGKWVTGSQLKAYGLGSTAIITDNDFLTVIHSGVAYSATGAQLKTYLGITA